MIKAINISGTNIIVISKIDILINVNVLGYDVFKLYLNNELKHFKTLDEMKNYINKILMEKCILLKKIIYSDNPKTISL